MCVDLIFFVKYQYINSFDQRHNAYVSQYYIKFKSVHFRMVKKIHEYIKINVRSNISVVLLWDL